MLNVDRLTHLINQITPPHSSLIGRCAFREDVNGILAADMFYVVDCGHNAPAWFTRAENDPEFIVYARGQVIRELLAMMPGTTPREAAAVIVHASQVRRLERMFEVKA